jgi:hypothetical protein
MQFPYRTKNGLLDCGVCWHGRLKSPVSRDWEITIITIVYATYSRVRYSWPIDRTLLLTMPPKRYIHIKVIVVKPVKLI